MHVHISGVTPQTFQFSRTQHCLKAEIHAARVNVLIVHRHCNLHDERGVIVIKLAFAILVVVMLMMLLIGCAASTILWGKGAQSERCMQSYSELASTQTVETTSLHSSWHHANSRRICHSRGGQRQWME